MNSVAVAVASLGSNVSNSVGRYRKGRCGQVPGEMARKQMIIGADEAIATLDNYYGTPPRLIPWPGPGPLPGCAIAAAVSLVPNTFQEGVLGDGVRAIAGQMTQRGLGARISD